MTQEKYSEEKTEVLHDSTSTRCRGTSDQLITWGSPIVAFRWNDSAGVNFRDLSVREIQPA